MILISLIKVNLIKERTVEKSKSRKAGKQGSPGRPQREELCDCGAVTLQGTEGSSGVSCFICLAHGLGLNR